MLSGIWWPNMTSLLDSEGKVNLQSTLSSCTAATYQGEDNVLPHHPITCTSKLYYHEDGSMECEHSIAAPNNPRTQAVLNHSVASLIIELAYQRY